MVASLRMSTPRPTSSHVMVAKSLLESVSEALQPLRCGEDQLSVMPTFIFCLGMGMLIYQVLRQGRPLIFHRIPRDLLVQQIIFSWLINITLKGWMLFLGALDVLLERYYMRQLMAWFPPKWWSRSQAPDLSALPAAVADMLQPLSLKMFICTLVSLLPFFVIWKINKEGDNTRRFIVWLGPNRTERNELGFGRNFINRPSPVLDPPSSPASVETLVTCRSTGSLDVVLNTDAVDQSHHRPRHRQPATGVAALRATKSLH